MALDLSGVDEDMSDVVVTMQIPSIRHRWTNTSVVIIPSDSEDDETGDLAIMSEVDSPSNDMDNEDCIIESYQPGESSVLTGAKNATVAVLTVQPIGNAADNVNIGLNTELLGANSSEIQLTSNGSLVDSTFTTLNPDVVLSDQSTDVSLLLIANNSNDGSKSCDIFDVQNSFQDSSFQCSQSDSSLCQNEQIFVNEALKFDEKSLVFNVDASASANTSGHDVLKPSPLITPTKFSLGSVMFYNSQAFSTIPVSGAITKSACLPTSLSLSDNLPPFCSSDMGICSNATDLSMTMMSKLVGADADVGDARIVSNPLFDSTDIASLMRQDCTSSKQNKLLLPDDPVVSQLDDKHLVSEAIKSMNQSAVRSSPNSGIVTSSLSRRLASRRRIERSGSSPVTKRRIVADCDLLSTSTAAVMPSSKQSSGSVNVNSYCTSAVSNSLNCRRQCGSSTTSKCTKHQYATSTRASPSLSEANGLSVATECTSVLEQSRCCACNKPVQEKQMSFCIAGHSSCGDCLQRHVKTLLASAAKGAVMCLKRGCQGYYLSSQLKNSLPSMVVEILEEKLNREYSADMSHMTSLGLCADDESMGKLADDGLLDLPKNWEVMSANEPFRKVELSSGSDEYNLVAGMFHQTMTWPRSQIVRMYRVQNHTLWQFYIVKRRQMARDSGSDEPVVEKHLFHGTSRQTVDAICLNNFDWRLSGTHGSMFGQGSYFAKDAAYSHMYTDPPPGHNGPRHSVPGSVPMYVFNSPYYRRSLFRASNVVGRLVRSAHGPKSHMTLPPVIAALPLPPAPPPLLAPPQSAPPPAHLSKAQDSSFFARILSFLQPAHQQPPSSASAGRGLTFNTGLLLPSQTDPQKASSSSGNGIASGRQPRSGPGVAVAVPQSSKYPQHCQDAHKSMIGWRSHHHSSLSNKQVAGSSAGNGPNSFSTTAGISSLAPQPQMQPHKTQLLMGWPPTALPLASAPAAIGLNSTQTSVQQPQGPPDWTDVNASSLLPSHSQHVMFLARVLVGRSTVGCQDYRKPPPIDPSRPFDQCYDSCVNRTSNPTIYVTFNSAQCYPEYVIEYHNKLHAGDMA